MEDMEDMEDMKAVEAADARAITPAAVAMEMLLESARPRLLRLARLRGVPADAAEDVVQETLLEAWRCLDRLYDPTGAQRWLDEICRNVCRRHARRHALEQRHASPPATDDADPLQDIADASAADPLEALDHQDMAYLVDRALGQLPTTAREVIELCYLCELPQREATDRLGISLSALEARLHRARRQLRLVLDGPLRNEAEAFGLALDDAEDSAWHETRMWCTLCGRHHLAAMFIVQPDGSRNLHMRCPSCEQRSGLIDADSSTIHSKGLVALDGLSSFRPAWKRTMQQTAVHFTRALAADSYRCLYCGAPATFELLDKAQTETIRHAAILPDGVMRHPYQFWVQWRCQRQHADPYEHSGAFAASDLVYWSHRETQQFMGAHPHCVGEPELLVEHLGQPALRLTLTDTTTRARLTLLADRRTLRVLASY